MKDLTLTLLFNQLNQECFNGELPPVKTVFTSDPRDTNWTPGCFMAPRRREFDKKRKIFIAEGIKSDQRALEYILLHEMSHCYLWSKALFDETGERIFDCSDTDEVMALTDKVAKIHFGASFDLDKDFPAQA